METPELETIRIEADAGARIGRLTLDRAEKLNPLSTRTLEEIAEAAAWFDRHPAVRVVIVSGAGRAFSAGADIASFGGRLTDPDLSPRDAADAGRLMADALEAMRAVTIARIHGHCVGGGVVLAAACDLRVAAADTRFSIPEVDLGIPLAWGGIPRLVREIGPAAAKELVMTCRPFDAAEAHALGLVNRVVPTRAARRRGRAARRADRGEGRLPRHRDQAPRRRGDLGDGGHGPHLVRCRRPAHGSARPRVPGCGRPLPRAALPALNDRPHRSAFRRQPR